MSTYISHCPLAKLAKRHSCVKFAKLTSIKENRITIKWIQSEITILIWVEFQIRNGEITSNKFVSSNMPQRVAGPLQYRQDIVF